MVQKTNINMAEFEKLSEISSFLEFHGKLRAWLKSKAGKNLDLIRLSSDLRNPNPLFVEFFKDAIIPYLGNADLYYLTQQMRNTLLGNTQKNGIYELLNKECEKRFNKDLLDEAFLIENPFDENLLLANGKRKATNLRKMRMELTKSIQHLAPSFQLTEVFLKPIIRNFAEHNSDLDNLINSLRPKSTLEKKCDQYEIYLIKTAKKELENLKKQLDDLLVEYYTAGTDLFSQSMEDYRNIGKLINLFGKMETQSSHQKGKSLGDIANKFKSLFERYKDKSTISETVEKLAELHFAKANSFDSAKVKGKHEKVSKFISELREVDIFNPTPEQQKKFSPVRFWQRTPHDKFSLSVVKAEQKANKRMG